MSEEIIKTYEDGRKDQRAEDLITFRREMAFHKERIGLGFDYYDEYANKFLSTWREGLKEELKRNKIKHTESLEKFVYSLLRAHKVILRNAQSKIASNQNKNENSDIRTKNN